MFSKKSQAAIEFLMIIGIAFTLLIPALFMFQQFSSQANEKLISAQINSFGRELITSVESIYYYGEYAKTSLKFNFPKRIIDMKVNTPEYDGQFYELVITADIFGGVSDFVFFTKVPIASESENETGIYSDFNGNIEPRADAFVEGMKVFRVESIRDPYDHDRLKVAIRRIIK